MKVILIVLALLLIVKINFSTFPELEQLRDDIKGLASEVSELKEDIHTYTEDELLLQAQYVQIEETL